MWLALTIAPPLRFLPHTGCLRMKRSRDEIEGKGAEGNGEAAAVVTRQKCPYLDTVNRTYLDFDFEKVR